MKFYFLDDDANILNLLKIIVKDRQLGDVAGTETSPLSALEDIVSLKPDIVIVDLLMAELDGIAFVNKASELLPSASYIMLSQVSSKDMIASAYEAGIEFFISKPLNSIEVESVIRKVQERLVAQDTLHKMLDLLHIDGDIALTDPLKNEKNKLTDGAHKKLLQTLQTLGMAGEKGSQDIILIVDHILSTDTDLGSQPFKQICSQFTDMPKTMEQRIRRAAATGLTNIAYMGLDDYCNPIFEEFAAMLFGLEQVRKEMGYIGGKSDKHGVVKIRNFINSLAHYCRR